MEVQDLCSLRDIYKLIKDFEARFQNEHDLTLNEGMLLCSLSTEIYTSGQIAEMLGLTNSNTSKIIKTAENKGYIKRILGKNDKRQMYFQITNSGLNKLSEIKCKKDIINELLNDIKTK